MGRTQRNQWLAEFESGAGRLENPLFLADVTMPSYALTDASVIDALNAAERRWANTQEF